MFSGELYTREFTTAAGKTFFCLSCFVVKTSGVSSTVLDVKKDRISSVQTYSLLKIRWYSRFSEDYSHTHAQRINNLQWTIWTPVLEIKSLHESLSLYCGTQKNFHFTNIYFPGLTFPDAFVFVGVWMVERTLKRSWCAEYTVMKINRFKAKHLADV